MSKYTPGPWVIMPPGCAAFDDLINIEKRNWSIYADSFGKTVHFITHGVEEANAHLIAAAPELKASLREILNRYIDLCNGCMDDPNRKPEVIEALRVLSKVKGAKI